jgi:hypothetical protein
MGGYGRYISLARRVLTIGGQLSEARLLQVLLNWQNDLAREPLAAPIKMHFTF